MSKKTISFLIPSLKSGGAERVTSILANYFTEYFDVIIITFSSSNYVSYEIDSRIKIIDCSLENSISTNFYSAIKNNFKIVKSIKSTLNSYSVSLVISLTTTANILALISCRNLNLPCIISERANPEVYKPNIFWKTLRNLYYPRASHLIVQTNFISNFFAKRFKKLKIEIIANPISDNFISKKSRNPIKENIILNVGRLDKNKAQDLLIKAFANIDNTNWSLVFVGNGIEKNNYIELTKKLRIENKVTFIEKTKTIENYYNKSKIFAFTSQSEGFPNALLEAMYFEMACISTNCLTGPSELITQNENGILIPVNDQKELEKELQLLIKNTNLQTEYGQKAHKSVLKYKSDIICDKWYELVKPLIK